jgi:extradiol dioxygenase family protein
VRHSGAILSVELWKNLVHRFQAASLPFLVEPGIRFEGQAGEQHTMFVKDPSGNVPEFKAFADDRMVFAR